MGQMKCLSVIRKMYEQHSWKEHQDIHKIAILDSSYVLRKLLM